MRRTKGLFLVGVMLLTLTGCGANAAVNDVVDQVANVAQSEDEHVLAVKGATSTSYPGRTYGEAFDSFFGSPTWKYFVGTQEGPDEDGDGKPDYEKKDIDVVEFTGYCTYDDVEVKAKIQFSLDMKNGTFDAVYLSFNDVPQSMLMLEGLLDTVFEDGGEESTEATDNSETYQTETETTDMGETEGYNDIIADTGANSEWCEYAYYDLDKDGIDELILGYGTCEADFYNEVYTTDKAGNISSAGGFDSSCMFYEAEDGNGIYAVYGHMGAETVTRVTLKNGSVVCEQLWQKELGADEEYYSNANPIQVYTYDESEQGSGTADYNTSSSEYVIPYSDTQMLTESDLVGLTKEECRIARNEIYARHGRMFSDPDLQSYFNSMSWYDGYLTADEFDESVLSQTEKDNLNTIAAYESKQGWR